MANKAELFIDGAVKEGDRIELEIRFMGTEEDAILLLSSAFERNLGFFEMCHKAVHFQNYKNSLQSLKDKEKEETTVSPEVETKEEIAPSKEKSIAPDVIEGIRQIRNKAINAIDKAIDTLDKKIKEEEAKLKKA